MTIDFRGERSTTTLDRRDLSLPVNGSSVGSLSTWTWVVPEVAWCWTSSFEVTRRSGWKVATCLLGAQRAEWRLLSNHLFTSDIARPFQIRSIDGMKPVQFDVVTAWEVLEHIADADFPTLFENIRLHLAGEGVFVGSITTIQDADSLRGAVYHRTVAAREWWEKRFCELGLIMVDDHPFEVWGLLPRNGERAARPRLLASARPRLSFCRGQGGRQQDTGFMHRMNSW